MMRSIRSERSDMKKTPREGTVSGARVTEHEKNTYEMSDTEIDRRKKRTQPYKSDYAVVDEEDSQKHSWPKLSPDDQFRTTENPGVRHSEIQCDMDEGIAVEEGYLKTIPNRSETRKMVEDAKRDPCAWLCLFVIGLLLICIILIAILIAKNEPDVIVVSPIDLTIPTNTTEPINNTTEGNSTNTNETEVIPPANETTNSNETEPTQSTQNTTTEETPAEEEVTIPEEEPCTECPPEPPAVVLASQSQDGTFTGEIEFGNVDIAYQAMWPTPEILASFDLGLDWRITKIDYKRYRNEFNLNSIRFTYDSGVTSPWCQAVDTRDDDEIISVDIDHRTRLTDIQMRVWEDGSLEGLRLYDEDGGMQFDETWYSFGEPSEWSDIKPIPEDQQIVGFKCEISENEIERLSFLLW